MLAMVWFEAQRSGLPFAIGFVVLILIHELGHAVAIKRAGLQAGWPVFVPFFGAMIALRGRPQSRDMEATIAYAGPLAGTAASLVVAVLGFLLHSRLCFALAYTGFFLNLFNLVPLPPLDGGRVATAFSPRAWMIGAALLAGLFLLTHSLQLLLIAFLALGRSRGRGKQGRNAKNGQDEIAPATEDERKKWTFRYFGLCFFLGLAMLGAQTMVRALDRAGAGETVDQSQGAES